MPHRMRRKIYVPLKSHGIYSVAHELIRSRSSWRRGSLLDGYQLHFEDQGRVRPDVSGALRSVGQVGGHKELPLRPYRHELQRLGPAGNHALYRERGRTAVLFRGIKLRPVDEGA